MTPAPEPLRGSSEGKGSNADTEGASEGRGSSSEVDDTVEPKLESPSPDNDSDVPEASSDSDDPDASDDSTARSKMLRGRIIQFDQQGYSIRHSNEYHIPTGNLLYISTNDSDGHVVEVVNSNAGMAQVKLVEGRFAGRSSIINIGVMR